MYIVQTAISIDILLDAFRNPCPNPSGVSSYQPATPMALFGRKSRRKLKQRVDPLLNAYPPGNKHIPSGKLT